MLFKCNSVRLRKPHLHRRRKAPAYKFRRNPYRFHKINAPDSTARDNRRENITGSRSVLSYFRRHDKLRFYIPGVNIVFKISLFSVKTGYNDSHRVITVAQVFQLLAKMPEISRCHIFMVLSLCQDAGFCQVGSQYIRIRKKAVHLLCQLLAVAVVQLSVITHDRIDENGRRFIGKILKEISYDLDLFLRPEKSCHHAGKS